MESVPHITLGWKKGGAMGGGGARLILSLFSQFIKSVSAHSIHTDPRSLCVRAGMFDIDRKLQEAALIAASSPLLLCASYAEQGHPTKMARRAKP